MTYEQEITQWQKDRLERLKSEDGWLTLVGLFWLKPGENQVGSDPSSVVILPSGKAPKHAASLWLKGGKVTIDVAGGVPITTAGKPVTKMELQSDESEQPTLLNLGSLMFHIIKRGDRLGVRVKDKENPARVKFPGLKYFPIDQKWRVTAKFVPYNPPKKVPIMNVLGMLEDQDSPGALEFQMDGNTYKIDALTEQGTDELFLIFADKTTGKETYGAGRYLYSAQAGPDGKVVVDFNKAYSPPCAFTAYATCPLPPPENKLALSISAGEKYSKDLHPK